LSSFPVSLPVRVRLDSGLSSRSAAAVEVDEVK